MASNGILISISADNSYFRGCALERALRNDIAWSSIQSGLKDCHSEAEKGGILVPRSESSG